MLTAQEILQENLLRLENTTGKPAQVGYDLSVTQIYSIVETGAVLKDRTIAPKLEELEPSHEIINDKVMCGWKLKPGVYDIVFNEGCKIPDNRTGLIRQRSSISRNTGLIASSIFDPGFETEQIGTILMLWQELFIEKDARVAQMYFHEHNPAEKYDGQWQNDVQRQKL